MFRELARLAEDFEDLEERVFEMAMGGTPEEVEGKRRELLRAWKEEVFEKEEIFGLYRVLKKGEDDALACLDSPKYADVEQKGYSGQVLSFTGKSMKDGFAIVRDSSGEVKLYTYKNLVDGHGLRTQVGELVFDDIYDVREMSVDDLSRTDVDDYESDTFNDFQRGLVEATTEMVFAWDHYVASKEVNEGDPLHQLTVRGMEDTISVLRQLADN